MNTIQSVCSAIALLSLGTTAAQANEIDYQEFEELFGEPVVTSVTGTPQRASELPASAIIVSGDDIRRTGATNLAEALRGYAGIDVARLSTGQFDLSIRGQVGVTNANTLVLVNGRQVYLENLGYTNWASIGVELDEIRQVEIVKGPNSAIFGFNAAAGVINIVTFNPVFDNATSASVQVGPDDRINASGVVTVPLGENAGIRFSAGFDQQDRFDSLVVPSELATERRNVGVDAGYDIGGKAFVRAGYNFSKSQQVVDFGQLPFDTNIETEDFSGSVSAEILGGNLSLSAQVSEVEQGIDFDGNGSLETSFDNDLEIYTAQFQRKLSSRTTMRVNADYRESTFVGLLDRPGGGRGLEGNSDYSSWAASLMLEQELTDSLTATGAIRFDSLDVERDIVGDSVTAQLLRQTFGTDSLESEIEEISYNLSLVYRANDNVTLRAQAARGAKLPSQLQFGGEQDIPGPGGALISGYGDPTLPASLVDSYEVGVNATLPSIGATAAVSVFYTNFDDVSNVTQLDPLVFNGQFLIPIAYQEVGEYDSYGFEVSLDGRDGEGFDWRVDYTFNDIDETFTDNLFANAEFGERTPKHKARVELGYNTGPFDLNLIGQVRSGVDFFDGASVVERDTAVTVDARAGYQVSEQVEMFVVGENLTGTNSFGNGGTDEDTRFRIGVRFAL